MTDRDVVPVPNDSFTIREIGDETIILSEEGNMIHMLNEVGSFIWKKIDGVRTLESIVELLTSEFDVSDAQAAQDVSAFVAELSAKGLVSTKKA
jgi:hypothetical protein